MPSKSEIKEEQNKLRAEVQKLFNQVKSSLKQLLIINMKLQTIIKRMYLQNYTIHLKSYKANQRAKNLPNKNQKIYHH